MKHITIIIWILALMPLTGFSANLLWSNTVPYYVNTICVGEDGSVAFRTSSNFISWYDRDGTLIANLTNSTSPVKIGYLTKDTLITRNINSTSDIHQLEEDHSITASVVGDLFPGTLYGGDVHNFDYPYFLELSYVFDPSNQTQIELFDLSSSSSPTIVGDAVIGIFGSNLKVRWKTLMNSKYKVQTSTDLTNWSDYTDVLDGTGATLVVNIPLDEHTDSLYARVVKL